MRRVTQSQIAEPLVLPYLNHAVRMLETGYATGEDIDAAMRFGCGYPTGPLAQLEERGLSTVCDALSLRFADSGDDLHQPAGLLADQAAAGLSSLKTAGSERARREPRMRRDMSRVGVVGTGTMATGIVQVFAQAGHDVVVVGRGEDKIAGIRAAIGKSLDKAVAGGRMDASRKADVLARLTGSTSRDALAESDLVIEAVAEDLAVKTRLFADLDRICKPGAVLATTTSSLPVTRCAEVTERPQDVIGMHFFNPAPLMRLVEVVTTATTSSEVDETIRALCSRIGKVAVSCADRAGFIVNALLFPYLNDAIKLVDSGAAAVTEVDEAMKEQEGFPMGPFELLDVVGNDVSLAIQKQLHAEFGHAGFAPAAGLERIVAAGRLGRKTGAGFHDYP